MVGEVFELQNAAFLKSWFVHIIIIENVGKRDVPLPANGCKSTKSFCNGEELSVLITVVRRTEHH